MRPQRPPFRLFHRHIQRGKDDHSFRQAGDDAESGAPMQYPSTESDSAPAESEGAPAESEGAEKSGTARLGRGSLSVAFVPVSITI